jgi:competence protein ComEC
MINWREVPFARLLFALLSGILLAIYLPKQPSTLLLWTGLLGSGVCLLLLNFVKITFQLRWLYGVALSLFLVLLGWQITLSYNELTHPQHFHNKITDKNLIVGKIMRIQPTSTGKTRLQLLVEAIQIDSNEATGATGNLLAYFDSSALQQLYYGDRVALYATITRLESPKNPKAFDFSRYMHFQNIHYQAFVPAGNWQLLQKAKGWNIMLLTDYLQRRFISILRKHVPGEDEFAVASALILGYRAEISEEINTAYRNTGATHVLAVSGMHVGFIYIGIHFLLGFIKFNRKSWKITKVLLELASIWLFALITGGAASILRAAVMFSFIIFGKLLQREANIYNSLAASAFFLLVINPYYLMDVGFQLSYLALMGIVYFEPKIYRLLYVKNKILDHLWKLTAVSIAAQIVTLPISLYYFHQFPWYFWLSGLAVIPASVVVLVAGFILFVVDGVPVLAWLIGKIIHWLVWLINGSIFLIQQIPNATTTGIWVSFAAVMILYGIILLVIIALNTRRFRWILAGLTGTAVLSLAYVLTEWRSLQQHQLIVYHVYKHTAIDYFDGKKLVEIRDDDLPAKKLQFANQNYRWFRRAQTSETILLTDSTGTAIFQFGSVKMAVLNSPWQGKKQAVDYVLIRGNPYLSLQELLQSVNSPFVIFDTSNSRKQVEAWQKEAKTLRLRTYDVDKQGALLLDMRLQQPR